MANPKMSLQAKEASVLIATLEAHPVIQELLWSPADNPGISVIKVFWDTVEEGIPPPYITLHHIFGGFDNMTPENWHSKSNWKVIVHATSHTEAIRYSSAIHQALHKVMPITTHLTGINAAEGWSWIMEALAIGDHTPRQKTHWYYYGGFYTVPLAHYEEA